MQNFRYAGVGFAFEQTGCAVVCSVCRHTFCNPIIPIGNEKGPHDFLYRRSDDRFKVHRFDRLMTEGAQRRAAAPQDAMLRVDQRSIQIEQNDLEREPRRCYGSILAILDLRPG